MPGLFLIRSNGDRIKIKVRPLHERIYASVGQNGFPQFSDPQPLDALLGPTVLGESKQPWHGHMAIGSCQWLGDPDVLDRLCGRLALELSARNRLALLDLMEQLWGHEESDKHQPAIAYATEIFISSRHHVKHRYGMIQHVDFPRPKPDELAVEGGETIPLEFELDRPDQARALSHLREGDVLVVWKLDRLGRTVKGLVDLVGELAARKVQFRSLTDGIDTTTPAGRFFFHVKASLAEMERELIGERTRAGLSAARKRGRVGGRKRRMTAGKVESARQLLAGGMPPQDVARNLGVSIPTLYRWLPASPS